MWLIIRNVWLLFTMKVALSLDIMVKHGNNNQWKKSSLDFYSLFIFRSNFNTILTYILKTQKYFVGQNIWKDTTKKSLVLAHNFILFNSILQKCFYINYCSCVILKAFLFFVCTFHVCLPDNQSEFICILSLLLTCLSPSLFVITLLLWTYYPCCTIYAIWAAGGDMSCAVPTTLLPPN